MVPYYCPAIKNSNIGCFYVEDLIQFYAIDFHLNHGINMHKHWSRRQLTEPLFNRSTDTDHQICTKAKKKLQAHDEMSIS